MKRVGRMRWLLVVAVAVMMTACGGDDGKKKQPDKSGDKITFNGTDYGKVTSPLTKKVWLDRNLGAAQVCTSFDDVACYGDYYQWGRNADGHEDSGSGVTTAEPSSITNVGHSDFIKVNSDWAKSIDPDGKKREANWAKTDGTSVCPAGYRVPTIGELKAELGSAKNRDNVFITPPIKYINI